MPSPEEFSQISLLCQTLATAPHYAKLGAGGVLSIWLTAREMNLPPMLCLNGGMYTFSGAVSLSANLINILLNASGHRADVKEISETVCTIEFVRGDRKEGEGKRFLFSYTIEQAQKAGYLSKDSWKKHPKAMLFARCLSAGCRMHMPMVLMGMYVHGEIGDNTIDHADIETIESQNLFIGQKSNEKIAFSQDAQINKPEKKGIDDVEKFKTRHNITHGEKIYDYVLNIAQKKKIHPEQAFEQCFLHEDQFIESFKKFEDKKIE